jgi:hypothetical protein
VKKLAIVAALCGSFISSPVYAKTFVGVLWPMFGPLPAIGLVELTAEIKMMPDVEVKTYLHQQWPDLVKDLSQLPDGTHTVVIGYSLGANATPSVANNSKYIDLIIALQPSMLSWNPPFTGKVGRVIEVYNPNTWMTFGGMGSKKLVGDNINIEYIANNDSHPGAQFNSDFRNLVKSEIGKFTAADRLEAAQAQMPAPLAYAEPPRSAMPEVAEKRPKPQLTDSSQKDSSQKDSSQKDSSQKDSSQKDLKQRTPAAKDHPQIAQAEMPKVPKPSTLEHDADGPTKQQQRDLATFLDGLSGSVSSGDLSAQRQLSVGDMQDYAKRTYHRSTIAELLATGIE